MKNSDEVLAALEMTDNDVLDLVKEWETVSGYDIHEVLASISTVVITARSGYAQMGPKDNFCKRRRCPRPGR